MYEIIQTETYVSSLFDCVKYVNCELQNPVAADSLLSKADYASSMLNNMPHRFPLSRYKELADKGIHIMPVQNHCIFYSIDDTAKIVYLHMFGYAPRKWDNIT